MLPSEENIINDVRSGVYEAHYKMMPGDMVLDLGANLGYFTEIASDRVGENGLVLAIEPHPNNFRIMVERIGHRPNVLPMNCGAMCNYGLSALYEHELNCGGHSFFPGSDHQKFLANGPTVDIGHLLGCFPLRPNFIKIDTEGAEIAIVKSLDNWGWLPMRIHMAIETHCLEAYRDVARMLLPTHNFTPETPHVGVCYATPK